MSKAIGDVPIIMIETIAKGSSYDNYLCVVIECIVGDLQIAINLLTGKMKAPR